jgi:hypothetical protein
MFLQDFILFLGKTAKTGLVLRDKEHQPNTDDIEDEIICEDGRYISIPNLRVIKIKLKTVN